MGCYEWGIGWNGKLVRKRMRKDVMGALKKLKYYVEKVLFV